MRLHLLEISDSTVRDAQYAGSGGQLNQCLIKTPSFPRKREPRAASIRAVALGPRFRGGDDKLLQLLGAFQVSH